MTIDIEKYNKLIPNKISALSDLIENARHLAALDVFQKNLPAGVGIYWLEKVAKEATYTAYYRDENDETNPNEIIMLLSNNNKIIVILRNRLTGNEIDNFVVSHQNEFLTLEDAWGKKYWNK